jgi:hypothetical protein
MEIPDFLYVAPLEYVAEPRHVSERALFDTQKALLQFYMGGFWSAFYYAHMLSLLKEGYEDVRVDQAKVTNWDSLKVDYAEASEPG